MHALPKVVELIRGRGADTLRVVLSAPDDLSAEEKRATLSEPLLEPPEEASDEVLEADEAAIAACLSELDARSLRTLKSVSRSWRTRARSQLGDPSSAWRARPEWSAGAWASAWYSERLASVDDMVRKRALLGMDALESTVELPQFADRLVGCLSDERSSCRVLALRALARLEPPTLALHAPAIAPALAALEPHEAESDAAESIERTLRRRREPQLEGPCSRVSGAATANRKALPSNDLRRRLSSAAPPNAEAASAKRARCA